MDWHPLDTELPHRLEPSEMTREQSRAKWQEETQADNEARKIERAIVEADLKTYLERQSTRELVDGIAQLRLHWYIWIRGENYAHDFYCTKDNNLWDIVKSILATRPHLPNKAQARAIRQQKAKSR